MKKSKIKNLFFLLAACMIFISLKDAFSSDLNQAQSLFYQGNTHYSGEEFDKAVTDYEAVLDLGYESGPLYYNLGNAYFKSGFLGKAIVNYLRAKMIMPMDADLKSNLEYAQSLIKERAEAPKKNWLLHFFYRISNSFNFNTALILCILFYIIVSFLVVIIILRKDLKRMLLYPGIIIVFLFLGSLSIAFVKFDETVVQNTGVVVSEHIDAKFEPFNDATTFFILYEGESIHISKSKDDWIKIERVDKKQGWVRKEDVELL